MLDNPKQFLRSLPVTAGVYQMYDEQHQILYVGKAKNLKQRLASYFRPLENGKTKIFMAQVKSIETIVTPSESAALLLESNLIKTKKPRYNILFKDDKSFPYLLVSRHDFPRASIYRGVADKKVGKYFGPFPDGAAVSFVLDLLQKVFRVRVCQDSYLVNRSRPCLLYQIKRCSAPCVGYVDQTEYALQVRLVEQFLQNQSDEVVQRLTQLMDAASKKLAYEQAANYRDQITNIRKVQSTQAITGTGGDCDVIAIVVYGQSVGVNLLFIRHGMVLGNKNYVPKTEDFPTARAEVLSAFIMHYYLQNQVEAKMIPDKILLNVKLPDRPQVTNILQEKLGRRIIISDQIRGAKQQLITMAEANAINFLKISKKSLVNYQQSFSEFKKEFSLFTQLERVECFDVSHTMGEAQVVSCVVFNEDGPSKKDYRRFNVKTVSAGDDYGALRQALLRHYGVATVPNVLIIDGGLGQLGVAAEVLHKLRLSGVLLIAIAKGKTRQVGLEEIYIQGKKDPLILPPSSKALHFIQQIRDEAHRFAISGHRKRMLKSRCRSELENIPGIGKEKRSLLLKHFGGMVELRSSGIDDFCRIRGIGRNLARRIYEYLHAR